MKNSGKLELRGDKIQHAHAYLKIVIYLVISSLYHDK